MLPIYNAKYSIYNWLVKSLGGRNHSLSLYIEALFPWTKPAFFGHVFFKCFETLGWFWTSFFTAWKKFWIILTMAIFSPQQKYLWRSFFHGFLSNSPTRTRFGNRKKRQVTIPWNSGPNILRWKRWFWTKQWLWARRQWSLMMFVTYHTHTHLPVTNDLSKRNKSPFQPSAETCIPIGSMHSIFT